MELGYFLSSEEQRPEKQVKFASQAEEAGFQFLVI